MILKNRKVLAALLLILALLAVSFTAPAEEAPAHPILKEGETEGSGTVSGTWIPGEGTGISNDRAISAYIRRAFSGSSVSAGDKYASVLGDRLTGANKKLYETLRAKMVKAAEGEISHVSFEVSYPLEMTLQSVRNDTDNLTAAIGTEMKKVFEALIGDCAAEQYWFDKVKGIDWSYTYDYNSTYVWITRFYPSFNVAAEYSRSRKAGTYDMNTSKAGAIRTAAANAKEIVAENRGKSDFEKLKAYKNKICELTDYNWDAVDGNTAYGNPWQLVWVFDGDPETKVVCEGYSKAFQYLWELSSFGGNVTSMLMTGNMLTSDGYGGAHMWNVVTMSDGNKYLVDVTNCDTGSTGNDTLFLVGYDSVGKKNGAKAYRYGNLYYIFDRNVSDLYRKEDRDLDGEDYDPDDDDVVAYGTCGKNLEWSLTYNGILTVSGSGAMDDYKSSAGTPWADRKDSISKIVVGDKVTKIGSNAFAGLKNAKSAVIGKAVNKIGTKAFYQSAKMNAFTIRTKKLKAYKVGSNAFKETSKKAVFTCPEGKRAAYKTILIKKGANKEATFK